MSLKPSSPLNRSESSVVVAWSWGTWWAPLFLLLVVSPVAGQTASSTGNADSCGDVRPGIVVETVAKNSEAEKAGIVEGDVLLGWTRGEAQRDILSPFDLKETEIEQEPRGQVTLEGTRHRDAQTWTLGPDQWGIEARPNLSEPMLAIYSDAHEMAKADRLSEAAERWDNGAAVINGGPCSWLKVWFPYHEANRLADSQQWKESDWFFDEAVRLSATSGPHVRTVIFLSWAYRYWQRRNIRQFAALEQRALDESLKLSDESLAVARSLNGLGISAQVTGDLTSCAEYYRRALVIRQKLAPGSLDVAQSLNNLGEVARVSGDLTLAQQYYSQALDIRERIDPGDLNSAGVLENLGVVARGMGNFSEAETYGKRALAIQEKLLPRSLDVAGSLNSLGNLSLLRGDLQAAERYFLESLAIEESLAPGSLLYAMTLMNAGNVAHARGELRLADEYYQKALAIQRELAPEGLDIAMTLAHLGMDARERGDFVQAEQYFKQNLELTEGRAPGSLDVANSYDNLADLANSQGNVQEAEKYCRKALDIQQKGAPHSIDVANGLDFLSQIAFDRGDVSTAENYNRQARNLRKELAPESAEYAESLAFQARLTQSRGDQSGAAQLYAQAIDVLDHQLTQLGGSIDARALFRSKRADYYSNYADLLVRQNKPELAFEVLERSRARTLLEMLAGAHVDIRQGADPALIEKERLLQATLTAKTNRKINLLEGEHTEGQVTAINKEMDEVLSRYLELEGQIHASSPKYAALKQPEPLRAGEVQQQLLDADTVLLEYALGVERSLVFLLTPTSLVSYELPKRADIETTAQRAYGLLTTRNRRVEGETSEQRKARHTRDESEYKKTAATLSQMVLGPVAEKLSGKRLLIVGDGALQYIPFAALPVPAGDTSKPDVPLVAEHEIVNLPSASVLALLRRQAKERGNQPTKEVAILADPVFENSDPRVRKAQKPASAGDKELAGKSIPESTEHLTRSIQDVGLGTRQAGGTLPRLAFSRHEAAAIMAIAKPGTGMEALDFQASRETALSKELSEYRIVHFATHGLLDNEHPELSGLVLSLVDSTGMPRDGFVDLQDVYNLTMPADLVVLSACDTGLGKEITGEGLVGLTRGFMYAGASRVVASLWKVDDVATSELMAEFYNGMFRGGLSPAAALRQAQLEVQKRKGWADPYYWAAFTIQGEWK